MPGSQFFTFIFHYNGQVLHQAQLRCVDAVTALLAARGWLMWNLPYGMVDVFNLGEVTPIAVALTVPEGTQQWTPFQPPVKDESFTELPRVPTAEDLLRQAKLDPVLHRALSWHEQRGLSMFDSLAVATMILSETSVELRKQLREEVLRAGPSPEM